MAVAGVLATALTTHAARSKGLFVHGQDVIDEPTSNTMGYGVPMETVHVTEMGVGGVSSMSFTIDDPNRVITVNDGDEVRFHNLTGDYPIFLGWVQAYELRRAFGDTGRQYDVTCVGVETVLDWGVLGTDFVLALDALTVEVTSYIQALVSQTIGLGPIRAFAAASTDNSRQETPIQKISAPTFLIGSAAITIPKGTTLREAIRQLYSSMTPPGNAISILNAWVDFTYGLRIRIQQSPVTVLAPVDYTNLTIDNSMAPYTESLSYNVDGSSDVHQVMVIGTGVSTVVTDGSGSMGQVAVLNDTTITTAAAALAAGTAYLGSFSTSLRGSFQQIDFTPTATVHTNGVLFLTDTILNTPSYTLRIIQIDKTFHAVREDWTVQFGGMQPRASNLLRRLTRTVLS